MRTFRAPRYPDPLFDADPVPVRFVAPVNACVTEPEVLSPEDVADRLDALQAEDRRARRDSEWPAPVAHIAQMSGRARERLEQIVADHREHVAPLVRHSSTEHIAAIATRFRDSLGVLSNTPYELKRRDILDELAEMDDDEPHAS